jgi:hypothetical protein
MVEGSGHQVERSTESITEPRYVHRRVGHRMGSEIRKHTDSRTLDRKGETRFHKGQRATSDPVRSKALRGNCKKQGDYLFTNSVTAMKYVRKQGRNVAEVLSDKFIRM